MLGTAPKSGLNTILVTHKPNIVDALGRDWFEVKEGEASSPGNNGMNGLASRRPRRQQLRISAPKCFRRCQQCVITEKHPHEVAYHANLQICRPQCRSVLRQTAAFMPQPVFGDNGSGMHVHQSVWKGSEPAFAAMPILHRRHPKNAKALNAFTTVAQRFGLAGLRLSREEVATIIGCEPNIYNARVRRGFARLTELLPQQALAKALSDAMA